MKLKFVRTALITLVFLCHSLVSMANASIIDHGPYTEDTATGLFFLDLNIFGTDSFANLQAGVSFGGFFWSLATVNQFTTFLSNGTGSSVPIWDGSNLSDFNLNPVGLGVFITLFSGSTSSGEFALDGQGFGQARAFVHTGFDDVHITQSGNTMQGLFVRSQRQIDIPEPPTIILFALAGLAFISRRKFTIS